MKYPQYWGVVKDNCQLALKYVWEDMSSGGCSAGAFLAVYSDALSMFHDVADMEKIVSAEGVVAGVAAEIRKVYAESVVGESMFYNDFVLASRYFFRQEIERQVQGLVDHGFESSELDSCSALCKRLPKELVDLGHKHFEKLWVELPFLGHTVGVYIEGPEDEYEFRVAAARKACALNSKQMAITPWEALLFEAGEIPGVPQFTKVPESQLELIYSARKEGASYVCSTVTKLSSMISTLLSKQKVG